MLLIIAAKRVNQISFSADSVDLLKMVENKKLIWFSPQSVVDSVVAPTLEVDGAPVEISRLYGFILWNLTPAASLLQLSRNLLWVVAFANSKEEQALAIRFNRHL